MRFGVQMYGMGSCWLGRAEAFLRELADIGCRQIEPCLAVGWNPAEDQPFLTADQLAGLLPLCRGLDIEVTSAHVFAAMPLAEAAEPLRRAAEQTGIRQLVLKPPVPCTAEACAAFARDAEALATALKPCEVEILLHNEREELVTAVEGMPAYQWILAHAPSLGAQVDVGWAMAAGCDPEAILWQLGDRVRSLHYKDFDAKGEERVIGEGCLDVTACFQFARAHGIPQIADMDSGTVEDLAKVMRRLAERTQVRDRTDSVLCVYDTETDEVRDVRTFAGIIEAPNWLLDGDTILYNREGRIWRYSLAKDAEELLDTGECIACNNDHVPSPDNRLLAVSSHNSADRQSRIYTLPMSGGEAVCVTENAPSYLHGWKPDGSEVCYCAFRTGEDGRTKVDIWMKPVDGGEERCLTDGVGYNDGPEFAPDGRIWYNSTRNGLMQVFRMRDDGSENTQMTFSEENNWFGHVSPDGRRVVSLAFRKGDLDPWEHLSNMQVKLYLMDADGGNRRLLLDFFGGQGSINVNSWAPDSRRFAFVRYILHHQ